MPLLTVVLIFFRSIPVASMSILFSSDWTSSASVPLEMSMPLNDLRDRVTRSPAIVGMMIRSDRATIKRFFIDFYFNDVRSYSVVAC